MDFERIAANVASILAEKEGIKRCEEPDSGWCWDSTQNRVKMIHTEGHCSILLTRAPYQTGPSGRYLSAMVQPSLPLTSDATPEQIASGIEELLRNPWTG
jgi:hypothetical protein